MKRSRAMLWCVMLSAMMALSGCSCRCGGDQGTSKKTSVHKKKKTTRTKGKKKRPAKKRKVPSRRNTSRGI